MKKALFFAGLAAAALSFVGCNKEADYAGNGRKVEIVLSDVATRTINYGMSTEWNAGDELSVFNAAAGSTSWSSNIKFTVQDASANRATGEVELTADAYDWYAFYPYTKQLPNPTTLNPKGSQYERSGYTTVGGKIQSQKEDDNKEHLAGKSVPVFGNVKNVPANEIPAIEMKNAASVVRFKVTNGTTKALHILSVKFTAPEDIVGTYYIDFSGTTPTFEGSGATYVFDNVTVNNASPVDLAPDSNSEFYAVIKPFTAASGSKLTVEIEAENADGTNASTATKEITLTAATEFKAGYIKTFNLTYSGGAEVDTFTLAEIAAMNVGDEVHTNEVLVVAKNARGIMLVENGNFLQAFNNAGVTGEVGDIVTVSGEVGEYSGLKQIVNPVVKVISSGNEVVLPDPKVLDGAGMDAYASTKIELIQYVGKLTASSTYYNVEVTGAERKGSIQYPLNTTDLNALKGKAVTATGFFTGISGSTTQYVNIMSTSVVEAAVNVFDVTPPQINLPATATSTAITVTGNVDWTAEASIGATLTPDHGTGEGTITVTFPANTDAQVKEYAVLVRTTATGVNDEFEVNITQAAASDEPKFVKVTSASDLVNGKYLIVSEAGNAVLKDAADLGGGANIIAVTITSGEITVSDELKAAQFTFDFTNGFIKGPNGKYIGNTSATSNGLKTSNEGIENTINLLSNGDAEIISSQTYLRYNSASGESNLRFRYYKAASYESQKAIQLYKFTGDGGDTPEPPTPVTHAGTVDDPYTVANALAATEALGEGKTASDYSYTKGIVSKVDEVSTDHGNATYYISDDGTTAEQFYVFRGKYIGKTNFTDENQLQVGDEVVVCGKLKNYKPQEGDAILELTDNYIHSLKRNGAVAYAFNASVSSTSASSGGATVKVNVFGNVNWTAAATGGATLEKSSGNGYSSFNVTIPANETTSEKTYTVTVSTTAAVSNNSIMLTITQEAKGDGNQYVLDLTTATYSSATEDQVVWDTPVMTITVNKAGASTNANNYLGGSGTYTSSRFYKNSTVTFAPKSGVTVTSMVCSATSTNYATAFASSTWSNATAVANDKVITVTPTNGANAMEVSIGAVCGFNQIVIKY